MELTTLAGAVLGAASALPGLLGLGRDEASAKPAVASDGKSAAPHHAAPADLLDMQGLRRIVSRYDFGQITPRQLGQLVAELGQQQALEPEQLSELALMRVELEQAGIEPDQPVDLVAHFHDQARQSQRQAERLADRDDQQAAESAAEYRQALAQLAWARKLALVGQQPPEALVALA